MSTYKILMFSDVHIHDWFRNLRDNLGAPIRFAEMYDQLAQVIGQEIADGGYSLVVFGGDLFETKGRRNDDVWSVASEFLGQITSTTSRLGIHCILMVGNHDRYSLLNPEGHSLDPFNGHLPNTSIVDTWQWHYVDGRLNGKRQAVRLLFVSDKFHLFTPMNTDDEAFNPCDSDYYAMFTHADMQGAEMHPGIATVATGLPEPLVTRTGYSLRHCIFNGHYHTPARLTLPTGMQVINVGAALSCHWGDAADGTKQYERGMTTITIDTAHLEKPPIVTNKPIALCSFMYRDNYAQACTEYCNTTGRLEFIRPSTSAHLLANVPTAGLVGGRNALVAGTDSRKMLLGFMRTQPKVAQMTADERKALFKTGKRLYDGQ